MAGKKSFKNLWPLISGILLVLFGLYVLFNPAVALAVLALYIGIAFIVVGSSYMMAFLSWNHGGHLAVGLLDIFMGLILVGNLSLTAASLPLIFALWTLCIGAIQITEATQLKKIGFPWQLTMTSGVIGLLFGFTVVVFPMVGAVTITFLIGSYIMLYGALGIMEYNLLKSKH